MKTILIFIVFVSITFAQKPYINSFKPTGTTIIYYLISNEGDTLLSSEGDTLITQTGLIYENNNLAYSNFSNGQCSDIRCWADKRKYFIGVKSSTCAS